MGGKGRECQDPQFLRWTHTSIRNLLEFPDIAVTQGAHSTPEVLFPHLPAMPPASVEPLKSGWLSSGPFLHMEAAGASVARGVPPQYTQRARPSGVQKRAGYLTGGVPDRRVP